MSSSASTRARPIGARCRLYLITPPDLDARAASAFAPRLAEALDAGDVACVQLRIKDADDDGLRRACDALRPVAQGRDVAFVLNDRPDLAAETGCDGVHVGQEDAPCREARAVVGDDAIVGVSCADSYHLALEAGEAGADYVAFGAFFPTATKQATARAQPDLLRRWRTFTTVPCVAIGGVTEANCGALVEAGADFLAVAAGVWSDPRGAARAVRGFDAAIAAAAG